MTALPDQSGRRAAVRVWGLWCDQVKPSTYRREDGTERFLDLRAESHAGTDDEKTAAVLLSVSQGNSLASALKTLQLGGNFPFNGAVRSRLGTKPTQIDNAEVTILGPSETRLEKLRKLWTSAKAGATDDVKQAALQELFAPQSRLDRSVPNLSSIVLLVEFEKKRLLLTGDARGDHIVEDWVALKISDEKRKLDVLKVPHHGSWANNPRVLFEFFQADHYIFSGDGAHGNPHPKVIEGLIELQGHREITLHFTNANVAWEQPHNLQREGRTASNLQCLLTESRSAYGGNWKVSCRDADALSVMVDL
jgi:hypothetical protein